MANFRNVVVSIGFTALILSLYGADAYGHGGGLDQYGCHNDHQRGGYHCHRDGGGGDDKESVSLNLLLGVHPEISRDYRFVVGGIVGARQAEIEGLSKEDLRWRVNYGGMVGLSIRRFFIGARWTTEGWGAVIGIGTVNRQGLFYGFGGEKMGGIGGAGSSTLLKTPVLIGGDIGFGGEALPK